MQIENEYFERNMRSADCGRDRMMEYRPSSVKQEEICVVWIQRRIENLFDYG